jgi:hypothetical protein
MTHVVYRIVKHGTGWAYQVGETYSETYLNHDDARHAGHAAAREHELAGSTASIAFEWHEELSNGNDRPNTSVIK